MTLLFRGSLMPIEFSCYDNANRSNHLPPPNHLPPQGAPARGAEASELVSRLGRAVRDLEDVLFPTECAGCGIWDQVVCDQCLALLLGKPCEVDLDIPCGSEEPLLSAHGTEHGDGNVFMDDVDAPASVPGFAVTGYAGAMRRFVLAGKHDPRLELRPYFTAAGENAAFVTAGSGLIGGVHEEVFVIPAPSTTPGSPSRVTDAFAAGIARGLVKGGAAAKSGVLEILRMKPGAKKQAGLGYSQRVTNRHHQMDLLSPRASGMLGGVVVVLVDDVSATGSTLREMARVLRAAGARVIAGFVFATGQRSV